MSGHRHTAHEHEHEFEAEHGLPEPLPHGERVLWQGSPDWRELALHAFHVRKAALYFGVILALHAGLQVSGGAEAPAAAVSTAKLLVLALAALGVLAAMAWLSSRTTVYTLTDRRVVMRIGIVLTLTFNLPFARIEGAALHARRNGRGDIAVQLARGERIAFLHLWPHVRPWRLARTEPQLRGIENAAGVAELLAQAWRVSRAEAGVPRVRGAPSMAQGPAGAPRAAAPQMQQA